MKDDYDDALEMIKYIWELLTEEIEEDLGNAGDPDSINGDEGEEEEPWDGRYTFAELAEMYSEDPGSYADGGYIGEYTEMELFYYMDYAFAEAASQLMQPGEMSGIFMSQFGFHIILLEDIFEQTYDDVFGDIYDELLEERSRTERIRLLESLDIRPESIREMLLFFGW